MRIDSGKLNHTAGLFREFLLNMLSKRFGTIFLVAEDEDSPDIDDYLLVALSYAFARMIDYPVSYDDEDKFTSMLKDCVDRSIKYHRSYWTKPPKTIPWRIPK